MKIFWRAQTSEKDSVTWKNKVDGLILWESSSFNLTMIPATLIKNPSFTEDDINLLPIMQSKSLRIIFDSSSFLIPFIQLIDKLGFFYLQNLSIYLLSIPIQFCSWSSYL